MFSQETRTIIERLVSLGRADLVVLVAERRISPEAAGRIAERGAPARETHRGVTKTVTETSPRTVKPETAQPPLSVVTRWEFPTSSQRPDKVKPAAPRPDVRALIG
jgi:hypothetical protein